MRICQITAIFVVKTVRISQRPGVSIVSGYTLYNSTIFLGLEVYILELHCLYKEVTELEANNIFISVLFEL